VLGEDIPAVFGELGVFHLEPLVSERRAFFGEGAAHGGRAKLVDFGGEERGPAGLAVAGLIDNNDAGTVIEDGTQVFRRKRLSHIFGEGEEDEIEFGGELAEEVVDADGATVGERIGEVGRQDGDASARGGARAAFEATDGIGGAGALADRKGPPAGTEPDTLEGDAAPEEE